MPKYILVTGGTGFLGSEVVRQAREAGHSVDAIGSTDYDLRDREDVLELFDNLPHLPDILIHCAGRVGGIGLNQARPADLFHDNLAMGLNLMEIAERERVPKFVNIGTVCSYPLNAPIPFKEASLFEGLPEPTNAAYGLAKRALIAYSQALRQQFGFDCITVIPTNLYGPGMDENRETSHVIPAMLSLMIKAKVIGYPATVILWGSGQPTRDFLHVRDAARGILLAAEKYSDAMPVNLGGTGEVSMLELATKIAHMLQFEGQLVFDHTHPDGQPRRAVSSERAKELLGWEPSIALDEGLMGMIDAVNERHKE